MRLKAAYYHVLANIFLMLHEICGLMGLQSVYLNKVLLKKISDIMMEEMLPEVNKKDGRYGMDFWKIFVLHVVKRGANIMLQDKFCYNTACILH